MMFPLLEYLDELINDGRVSYNSNDVAAARLALLRPTHMVDYAIDIYRGIHGADSEVPKEMEDQKAKVYQKLGELEKGCKALHDLCANEEERVSLIVWLSLHFPIIVGFDITVLTVFLPIFLGETCCCWQMECRWNF